MKNYNLLFLFSITLTLNFGQINAQSVSASNYLVAQPVPDRTIIYNVSDAGVSKPITWGLDLAWLFETNVKRGIAFMGKDNVKLIRSSFMPTSPLVGDTALQNDALSNTNLRIGIITRNLGTSAKVVLNDDNPTVDPYFAGNAAHWAKLIETTAKLHIKAGLTVATVSPFNEPDYSATGQGTVDDFYNICGELRNNPFFDNIRISGGNTLNDDVSLTWYNYLKDRLDEGNTHQLAGTFDNYATFYQTVSANGDIATNDELHNVMEAMVGVEYGLQNGIWWGTAELARGEFCKASNGVRLGYAEHRSNWTAASVYRGTDGKVQAFGGGSERQSVTTTYRFVSKDRDVYYNGYGPQREYSMVLPGGAPNTYQTSLHVSPENVVNVTWGDDIQPVINGQYVLVNRMSKKAMEVYSGFTNDGAAIVQRTYNNLAYQQWNIAPVDTRIGGDFSYYAIVSVNSGKYMENTNYSLDNNSIVTQYTSNNTSKQQWYFDYAGDGWFYIRNRESSKCLQITSPYVTEGLSIVQNEKNGSMYQQWRLIPVGASVETSAPIAPVNLTATSNATSIQLNWTANTETDLAGYNVYRSETSGSTYNTIARNITSNSFVDNTPVEGKQYFYVIKAVDNSLNRSPYSNEVTATANGNPNLVSYLQFNGNLQDTTINLNHSAIYGNATYVAGKIGSGCILLSGSNNFVQLPATVANHNEITVASWVNWLGTTAWQRIFDFGNGENDNMFLTPKSGTGKLRFGIKKDGTEQVLEAPSVLPSRVWTHVAITLSNTDTKLYVNGILVAQSNSITFNPNDIKPVLNYIGRSQYADPFFMGYIDDFRIYNYALPPTEVAQLASGNPNSVHYVDLSDKVLVYPSPAKDILHVNCNVLDNNSVLEIIGIDGHTILNKTIHDNTNISVDVSHLTQGVYILKIKNDSQIVTKQFMVKR